MFIVFCISVLEGMGGGRIESGGIFIVINDISIFYDDVEIIFDVF